MWLQVFLEVDPVHRHDEPYRAHSWVCNQEPLQPISRNRAQDSRDQEGRERVAVDADCYGQRSLRRRIRAVQIEHNFHQKWQSDSNSVHDRARDWNDSEIISEVFVAETNVTRNVPANKEQADQRRPDPEGSIHVRLLVERLVELFVEGNQRPQKSLLDLLVIHVEERSQVLQRQTWDPLVHKRLFIFKISSIDSGCLPLGTIATSSLFYFFNRLWIWVTNVAVVLCATRKVFKFYLDVVQSAQTVWCTIINCSSLGSNYVLRLFNVSTVVKNLLILVLRLEVFCKIDLNVTFKGVNLLSLILVLRIISGWFDHFSIKESKNLIYKFKSSRKDKLCF